MAGATKTPYYKDGAYRGWYRAWVGSGKETRFFKGVRSYRNTLRMAQKLEEEENMRRAGILPPELPQFIYADVAKEYIAWGNAQGGLRGGAWNPKMAPAKRYHLAWWQDRLTLETMADMFGTLPRIEAVIRQLQQSGRTPRTVNEYIISLTSFARWAFDREYLPRYPFERLKTVRSQTQTFTRAFTTDEIKALRQVAMPHRELLYQAAMHTGLRANELRSLVLQDLDMERCLIDLKPAWTKNRKGGKHPIPAWLADALWRSGQSREPAKLYAETRKRYTSRRVFSEFALLFVPANPAESLDIDLAKAGIAKRTPEGRLIFGSFRHTYITMLSRTNIPISVIQQLARHATLHLTLGTYTHVSDDQLYSAINAMSIDTLDGEPIAHRLQPQRKRASMQGRETAQLHSENNEIGQGQIDTSTPRLRQNSTSISETDNPMQDKPKQRNTRDLRLIARDKSRQIETPEDTHSGSLVAHSVQHLPDDLRRLITAWGNMTPEAQAEVMRLIETGKGDSGY